MQLESDMCLKKPCPGVPTYGPSFNAVSTGHCLTKLKTEPLRNTPGRITKERAQVGCALELLCLFGPVDI